MYLGAKRRYINTLQVEARLLFQYTQKNYFNRGTESFRSRAKSLPGQLAPRPFHSLALLFTGTFAPWNFRSVALSLRMVKITIYCEKNSYKEIKVT